MLAKPAPRDSKQAHASVSLAPVSSLLTPLRYAWLVVALLWLVALLNYFDRLLITTMRDPIKVDIAMTVVEQVVDLPGVTIFEVPDNLDSTFYSPRLFRAFCLPLLRQAAAMIHARGKYLFIHACGRLKALAPLIFESGLDCVEGQAHPPLGDWHLHEARALSPRLILCGGMTANEQQWRGPGTARRIDDFVRGLLDSLGDRRRFVLASGCNTSPHTPIENLIAFRDAAWKYGRFT